MADGIKWVVLPFGASAECNTCGIRPNTYIKEGVIEISLGITLKSWFQFMSVDSFWISLKDDYTKIMNKAVDISLSFTISHLCEVALSALK